MPRSLLDSGSEFDQSRACLGKWLRDKNTKLRSLTTEELKVYVGRFVVGWSVSLDLRGEAYQFHVLVDSRFPYSRVRIALKTPDMFLRWPHVEPGGLLCLPRSVSPLGDIDAAADEAFADALKLIDQCNDGNFVRDELQREFVSYWAHETASDKKPVHSLLDPTNHVARLTAVWFGSEYTLVGESAEQLRQWLSHHGTEKASIESGAYAHLREAPIPPFPGQVSDLFSLLEKQSPDTLGLILRCRVDRTLVVTLGANAATGDGLVALRIAAPKTDGFRKGQCNKPSYKKVLWVTRAEMSRLKVLRFDASWVHGRGQNTALPILHSSRVLLLGCGSLGSQVAMRLAQAGVGNLTLIDPDALCAANVGRHALGVGSIGEKRHKASELAKEIRRRFPHIQSVNAYDNHWQAVYATSPQLFETSDLIVACIGEWDADGQLGEWQRREGCGPPVVFGWLEARGAASHAFALTGKAPGLSCVLDSNGDLRVPDTTWEAAGEMQAEPACGTLFQPYGPIDVALAEALVSKLCLDVLTRATTPPIHRVFATSTRQLNEAGGSWSEEHLKHRPQEFEGAFEYQRSIEPCRVCDVCKAMS